MMRILADLKSKNYLATEKAETSKQIPFRY